MLPPKFRGGQNHSGANDGDAEQNQTVLEQGREEQRNAEQGLPAVPQIPQQSRYHQRGQQRVDGVFARTLGVLYCGDRKSRQQRRQKRRPTAHSGAGQQKRAEPPRSERLPPPAERGL